MSTPAYRIYALRGPAASAKKQVAGAAARAGLEASVDDRFPGYLLIALPDEATGILDAIPLLAAVGAIGAGVLPPTAAVRRLPAWLIAGALAELRSGPFEGMTGRILETDEERWSAKVGVELFGRVTPVAVEIEGLRKA
jgi:hypothetical protein